jgi:hypothetical protein
MDKELILDRISILRQSRKASLRQRRDNRINAEIAEKIVLKGHDFSRAAKKNKRTLALAAEGCSYRSKNFPRGLKPIALSIESMGTAEQAGRNKNLCQGTTLEPIRK